MLRVPTYQVLGCGFTVVGTLLPPRPGAVPAPTKSNRFAFFFQMFVL